MTATATYNASSITVLEGLEPGRGGRGHEFISRGQIVEVISEPVPAPQPLEGASG
jgi:hypothetical protein